MTEAIKPLFPNAITMLALAFGVSALNMALWGNWQLAVFFIFLAGIFDFLDGKIARLLGVSSRFGAELDSLSDFVSFGVAPGFLMYNWTMNDELRINAMQNVVYKSDAVGLYWGVVLFLVVCCASRLARFNTMLDEKQPKYWLHFFMGVPAPAGAALAILPLIFWFASKETVDLFRHPLFVSLFMIFSGVMMASRVPTVCLKHLRPGKTFGSVIGLLFLAFICGIVAFPWVMFSIVGVLYLVSIPVGIYVFMKLKKQLS